MNLPHASTLLSVLAVLPIVGLPGCTSSTGVVPAGSDTYVVVRSRKSFHGDGKRVRAEALREANEFCRKRGKVMKVVKSTAEDMKPFRADASAEVYFKALDPGDPELKEKSQ